MIIFHQELCPHESFFGSTLKVDFEVITLERSKECGYQSKRPDPFVSLPNLFGSVGIQIFMNPRKSEQQIQNLCSEFWLPIVHFTLAKMNIGISTDPFLWEKLDAIKARTQEVGQT